MLNILIVDDELLVRNNLRNLIDWGKYGFNICGEAVNGNIAMQMIEELKPNIVILDVNMPIMDGIALSEYINKKNKEIKMVVLSSYDNYEYVRNTLKNGAIDYVLKHHLDSKELLNILTKAKEEIIKETKEKEEQDTLQKKWNILSHMAKQNYIKELVLGLNEHTDEAREEYFDIVKLQMETKNMVLVVINISNYIFITGNYTDKEKNVLIRSITNLCSQMLEEIKNGIVTHLEQGKFVVLFSFEKVRSEADIDSQLNVYMNKIGDSLNRYLNIQVVWGASKPCNKFSDINKCYQKAFKIANGYLKSSKEEESAQTSCHKAEGLMTLSIHQEKGLLASIEILDINGIKSILQEVFSALKDNRANYTSQQMVISELINIVIKVGSKFEIDLQTIYDDKIKEFQSGIIARNENLDIVMKKMEELYIRLINELDKNNSTGNYSEYIRNAVEYVKNNYAKAISLDEIADILGITSSYLSHLFKEETGTSFVDFINNIKVEKAVSFIKNGDYKINDLYKKVGFNSYSYFFKVFKKVMGCTPLTFAKNQQSVKSKRCYKVRE